MTHTERTDLPITDRDAIRGVSAARIFEMLDFSYGLRHFKILPKIPSLDAVPDIFEGAVSTLAALAENRIRRGLYRRHVERPEDLRFIPSRAGGTGWLQTMFREDSYLRCRYDGAASDFEDNEILLWTLYTASKARLNQAGLAQMVRQSYRTIGGSMALTDENAKIGITRFYRRLHGSDRPIHGLYRLILEQLGPGLRSSGEQPIPLTVSTPVLFRAFVVAWLKANLPQHFILRVHHTVQCDARTGHLVGFDIAIEERASRRTVVILDTTSAVPEIEDVQQIVARAASAGQQAGINPPTAVLVHPSQYMRAVPADAMLIDGINLRIAGFDLSKDLPAAGTDFLGHVGLTANAHGKR